MQHKRATFEIEAFGPYLGATQGHGRQRCPQQDLADFCLLQECLEDPHPDQACNAGTELDASKELWSDT